MIIQRNNSLGTNSMRFIESVYGFSYVQTVETAEGQNLPTILDDTLEIMCYFFTLSTGELDIESYNNNSITVNPARIPTFP